MPGPQPKKMLILNILQILKDYTDSTNPDHKLTQKEIMEYLERDYDMVVDRKAVKRNLTDLIDAGFPIYADETHRSMKDNKTGEPDENIMYSKFYYDHDFTNGELRLLMDSVLFSKSIPAGYAKELITKISRLGNRYGSKYHLKRSSQLMPVKTSARMPAMEVFLTIEELEQAIVERNEVSLIENRYGKDRKLHPISTEPVIILPKQLIAANGYYYLIAYTNPHTIQHYRIDKLSQVKILPQSRSIVEAQNISSGDLRNYIDSHVFMSEGLPVEITMRIDNQLFDTVVDSFGGNFRIMQENEKTSVLTLKSTIFDMYQWALLHGDQVEILSPQSLREKLCRITSQMHRTYFATDDDRYDKAIRLAQSPHCQLQIHNIDLSGRTSFRKLSGLKSVDLVDNNLENIGFLKDQSELENLYLSNNAIRDFSPIIGLPRLTEVRLWNTGVESIAFLSTLPRLKRLMIHETNITDIEVLYQLHLSHLWLSEDTASQVDIERIKSNCSHVTVWEKTDRNHF